MASKGIRNPGRVRAQDEVELTPARPEDIPFLARQLTRLKLDQEDLHPDQFLLFHRGRRIIAFGRIKSYAGIHEMASLAVLEPFRGQGLGRLVAQGLLNRCPANTTYLVTDIPAFFEKLGFVVTEDVPQVLREKKERFCSQYSSGPVVAMVLCRGGR